MGQLQSYFASRYSGSVNHCSNDRVYDVLPPDILVKVFSYLNVASKGRAAQVSRAWREVARTPSIWTGAEVSRMSWSLFDAYVSHGIRRFRSPSEPFNREKWAQKMVIFAEFRKLKHITTAFEIDLDVTVRGRNLSADKSLVTLIEYTSKLVRSLTVRHHSNRSVSSISVDLITSECPNLVKLCIVDRSNRVFIDGQKFWNDLGRLRKLQCLVLEIRRGLHVDFLRCLVDDRPGPDDVPRRPRLQQLTSLHLVLQRGMINGSLVHIGRSLPQLVKLHLTCCERIALFELEHIAALTALERLSCHYPRSTTDHGCEHCTWSDESDQESSDLISRVAALSEFSSRLDSIIVVNDSFTTMEIISQFSSTPRMNAWYESGYDVAIGCDHNTPSVDIKWCYRVTAGEEINKTTTRLLRHMEAIVVEEFESLNKIR